MQGRVVIVGAGQGGFQAAASLRQEGWEGEILLVGDEPGLPYQRPPLSKAYMKDGKAERLALRPEAFFRDNRIELVEGRAVRLDPRAHELEMEGGRRVSYDKLILATGSRNRRLEIPGAGLDGVVELRTLSDAQAIRGRMGDVRRAVVIGGGFIGLEFAAVARGFGVEVTVLEAAGRVMSRVVSEPMSEFFHRLHREMGVDLRLGAQAEAVVGEGRATGVRLKGGEVVSGDLVVMAVGILPNAELAREAGLVCGNGVEVDAELRTSDPDVYALGDCACFVPHGRDDRLRLESVQNAVDGARAIAATLCGRPTALTAVPWFWSDQGEAKLQIAGLTHDADALEVVDRGEGKLCVFRFKGGRFVGLETVNAPADHMGARKLLAARADVTREELEAAGWNLRAVGMEAAG